MRATGRGRLAIGALIATESGLWVGACAARYALDAPVPIAPLVPMLQSALHSAAAPLREAAALALARAVPSDAPRLLAPLTADPAASVSRTVRALLEPLPPRAIA